MAESAVGGDLGLGGRGREGTVVLLIHTISCIVITKLSMSGSAT